MQVAVKQIGFGGRKLSQLGFGRELVKLAAIFWCKVQIEDEASKFRRQRAALRGNHATKN